MFKKLFYNRGEELAKLRTHIVELDKQLARSQERIRQLENEIDGLKKLALMHYKVQP